MEDVVPLECGLVLEGGALMIIHYVIPSCCSLC